MTAYLKKALSFGPFRINLSKSGLGISFGVTGFRVGTGPNGPYLHAGRGGVYIKKSLKEKTSENMNEVSEQKNIPENSPEQTDEYIVPPPKTPLQKFIKILLNILVGFILFGLLFYFVIFYVLFKIIIEATKNPRKAKINRRSRHRR